MDFMIRCKYVMRDAAVGLIAVSRDGRASFSSLFVPHTEDRPRGKAYLKAKAMYIFLL
jgi:hypothetical protein